MAKQPEIMCVLNSKPCSCPAVLTWRARFCGSESSTVSGGGPSLTLPPTIPLPPLPEIGEITADLLVIEPKQRMSVDRFRAEQFTALMQGRWWGGEEKRLLCPTGGSKSCGRSHRCRASPTALGLVGATRLLAGLARLKTLASVGSTASTPSSARPSHRSPPRTKIPQITLPVSRPTN